MNQLHSPDCEECLLPIRRPAHTFSTRADRSTFGSTTFSELCANRIRVARPTHDQFRDIIQASKLRVNCCFSPMDNEVSTQREKWCKHKSMVHLDREFNGVKAGEFAVTIWRNLRELIAEAVEVAPPYVASPNR